jgi:hypothetical protein
MHLVYPVKKEEIPTDLAVSGISPGQHNNWITSNRMAISWNPARLFIFYTTRIVQTKMASLRRTTP